MALGRDCPPSQAPIISTSLVVLNTKVPTKLPTRRVSILYGFSPYIQYGVFNSNLQTCIRAILERLIYIKGPDGFVPPPVPSSELFFSRLRKQQEALHRQVQYTPRLTKEQFLENYSGRRRTVYENAYESLKNKGLSRVDSYINFFLKVEKTNFTAKEDPVPRGISPRSPRYHVELGRFIKPIEKEVYRHIEGMFGARAVFKGLNSFARAKFLRSHWEGFTDPVAVGLDASRFDQHVSSAALEWEHNIYMHFFPRNKLLKKLLQWQRRNVGFGRVCDGTVKFDIEGRRMSGDMNTALGNCLLMCSLLHAYTSQFTSKFALANDGDDCVLIVERLEYDKIIFGLSTWFTEMGFSMKIEDPVYEFEKIVFCQSQPVCVDGTWIMVRDPITALSKDCVSLKPLDNDLLFRRWIAAVGEGGLSLAGRVPIWQEFYKQLYDSAKGAKPLKDDPTQETGLVMLCKGMRQTFGPISDGTRVSFYKAFGIEPARQRSIECFYINNDLQFEQVKSYGAASRLPWGI